VSEQFLNGTSAQLGYTVQFKWGYTRKSRDGQTKTGWTLSGNIWRIKPKNRADWRQRVAQWIHLDVGWTMVPRKVTIRQIITLRCFSLRADCLNCIWQYGLRCQL